MRVAHRIAALCAAVLTLLGAAYTQDQTFPNKPIRVLASEPGAAIDFTLRLVAPSLTSGFGQPVIVDNRSSGGFIMAEILLRAPPDGYTLLMQAGSFWLAPLLQPAPYDAVRDFAPVTLATNAPLFLYVHPSVPVKTLKEFLALAKAKPGELNYSSAGSGATNYLAAELFKSMAGVNIVRIPYKGTAQAVTGLVGNQAQMMFASATAGLSHVKAGRLKVLGVASAQPSALAPDVPTISSQGVPGYEAASMSGVYAPGKTPAATINRINREFVRVLHSPEAKEKMLGVGIETIGNSPAQAAAYIKADLVKWGKVIKDTGMRAE
jgi:tripartite-type tricarboxylate transporter receptor subunit TctC